MQQASLDGFTDEIIPMPPRFKERFSIALQVRTSEAEAVRQEAQ